VLGVSKAQWPWYYVENIPADVLPWTLLLPWALPWFWRNRNESAMHRLLWCWCVPALIFFSISVGKRAIYILPLFPIFAIIIAASLRDFWNSTARRRLVVAWLWGAICAILGGALTLAPWVAKVEGGAAVAVLGLLLLCVAVFVFRRAREDEGRGLPAVMALSMAALLAAAPFTLLPTVNIFKGAADFLAPVRAASAAGEFRLYSVGFSREEYTYYADHFHVEVLTDLVGRADIAPADLIKTARFQKDARAALVEALEPVQVADWGNVTQAEAAALHEAARAGLHDKDLDAAKLATFEVALREEVQDFAEAFFAAGDAWLMVQEDDWKWLVALEPRLREARFVHGMGVGSRKVLLVRNR
jgi:hypothetical protein